MKFRGTAALAAALVMALSQPAAAADDMRLAGTSQRATAGFVGLVMKVNGAPDGGLRPEARLRLGMTHYAGTGSGALAPASQQAPLEFGFSGKGRPQLFLAGQKLSHLKTRLGIAPIGIALLVGGVAASALVVSKLSEEEELNRYQCLLPEKELCK